jgi:hypothetical protein
MKPKLILLLLMTTTIFVSCSCEASFTTAKFDNLRMAKIEDDEIVFTNTFEINTDMIYLTGVLRNNPGDTEIKGEWYYLEGEEIFIDSATMIIREVTSDFNFSLSIPDAGWPAGKYEVRVYIDKKLQESINFEVK